MEEMFLMKPKIDYAFKEIVMDEMARVGFLSAMLKLEPSEIKETTILNTNLRKLYEDEKQGILDVLELPKLPEELKEDSGDILLWAKFINAERK